MQFQLLAIAFASLTSAAPSLFTRQDAAVCSGSYQPVCCATDVLGVADLNCANPPEVITNTTQFISQCSDIGQQAKCCLLPILEQGLICEDP